MLYKISLIFHFQNNFRNFAIYIVQRIGGFILLKAVDLPYSLMFSDVFLLQMLRGLPRQVGIKRLRCLAKKIQMFGDSSIERLLAGYFFISPLELAAIQQLHCRCVGCFSVFPCFIRYKSDHGGGIYFLLSILLNKGRQKDVKNFS